jgi:hypothetical protein
MAINTMIYGSAVLRYVGEIDYFPVNLPLSGNFLETIPAQTASTAKHKPQVIDFLGIFYGYKGLPVRLPTH